jgi:hypothetical protein
MLRLSGWYALSYMRHFLYFWPKASMYKKHIKLLNK